MKKSDVRELRDIVRTLCKELEETPWAIVRMETLMFGLIELARTKKPWVAVDVALTIQEELLKIADDAIDARRERERTTTVNVRTTHPSFTGFMQLIPDAPRPAATVEQMRAAADAAMASDDDLTEWTCDVCRKKTLTESMITPIGWSRTLNSNTGKLEYTCNECHKFGHKHEDYIGWFVCNGCGQRTATADGKKPLSWVFNAEVDGKVYKTLCSPCFATGIPKEYQCMGCDAETKSRAFPPPGWKEVEDGEVICLACAEEEAKP